MNPRWCANSRNCGSMHRNRAATRRTWRRARSNACSRRGPQHPAAQIVAGCTDVGLWITKMHMQFASVLDVTRVAELRRIERYPHHVAIGAAVTLTDAYAALVRGPPAAARVRRPLRRAAGAQRRHAGRQRRQRLADRRQHAAADRAGRQRGADGRARPPRDAAGASLYTGYRKNVMAPDEVLAWIKVPLPRGWRVAAGSTRSPSASTTTSRRSAWR